MSPVDATWRLSPMEALMWRLGTDPSLSAAFGSVTILDCEPDPAILRARLGAAARSIPRLRQRVVPTSGPVPGLAWALDSDFDLDHHLRWTTSPGPSEQEVLDLAAELVAQPFGEDHPPWNFMVVTGLAGGRAALVQRMHHVITDGKGGLRLSERFIDLERDAPPPPPDPFATDDEPEPPPSWLERQVVGATDTVSTLWRATGEVARWTAAGLTHPSRFVDAAGAAIETLRSLQRQVAVMERAHSHLWSERSSARRFVAGSVPFAPVRRAATDAGASINDVFVTAALRGAAAYHRGKGETLDELRVAIPVSTRRDDRIGGNAFSPTRVLLPAGEGLTAGAHLLAVAGRLSTTKQERALDFVDALATVVELVPAGALRAVARRQAATIDFAASNLRAAPVPLFIAGAEIEATYPIGPLAATAANITMMSYNGRLDLGIHVDASAVSDPVALRDHIMAAFHEMCAASLDAR